MTLQEQLDQAAAKLEAATLLLAESRRLVLDAMTAPGLPYDKHRPLEVCFNRLKILQPRTCRVANLVKLLAMV